MSAGVKTHHGLNQRFWCRVLWQQAPQRCGCQPSAACPSVSAEYWPQGLNGHLVPTALCSLHATGRNYNARKAQDMSPQAGFADRFQSGLWRGCSNRKSQPRGSCVFHDRRETDAYQPGATPAVQSAIRNRHKAA